MNCGIVIVLFHPDIDHVQSIVDEFAIAQWPIVIIDNSPQSSDFVIPQIATYLHFPNNLGIAQAQNVGLELLFSNHSEYAILLDQDSKFSLKMASSLLEQFNQLEQTYNIAALGPSILCQFSHQVVNGKLQKGQRINHDVKEVKQIIASGMILSKLSFNAVGEKESGLFIDGVDHEWCWRARNRGFRIFQSLSVCMPHRQGDDRIKILGLTFKQGAPIRLYYQMRNLLLLSRRNYVPFYWKCRHVLAIPLRYLVNRFYFTQGKERGYFMFKGLCDGLRSKCGRIEDN